jgi:hypothetical protein
VSSSLEIYKLKLVENYGKGEVPTHAI